MDIQLRLETPADYRAVEELTREAFWGRNNPGCDEHYLVHILRKSPGFIPELDFVAEANGQLVGNIMYSKSKIACDDGSQVDTINFGPLSVLPAYQSQGVGKALMTHSIREAQTLGYRAILFFGHPDYYPRFGFRRAAEFGITTWDGKNFDPFMAMPLYDGALDGITGRYAEDPAFQINAEDAAAFDQDFPPKEKCALMPISLLLDRLEPAARTALESQSIPFLSHLQGRSQREIAALPGIDEQAIHTIRSVMREYGYHWGESTSNQSR